MDSEKVKEIKKALELNEYFAIEYVSKSGEPKIFTFTDLLTLINELEKEKTEQLKHFAEMLKEKLFDLGNIVNENDIDETLKEFLDRK